LPATVKVGTDDRVISREAAMAHANPIQIQKYLKGVDYPADKRTLLETARREGADDNICASLEQLPDQEFQTPADVSEAFRGPSSEHVERQAGASLQSEGRQGGSRQAERGTSAGKSGASRQAEKRPAGSRQSESGQSGSRQGAGASSSQSARQGSSQSAGPASSPSASKQGKPSGRQSASKSGEGKSREDKGRK
jgi:hypothetical protein